MKYYTRYELEYIEQLAESNPEALRKYAVIVLSDGRRWDPDMDVPAIKAAIKEALWKIAERHNRQRLESKCP